MQAFLTEHLTPELFLSILDNSLTSIYAAKAIRDPDTDQLIDFQIYFANSAFLQRVHLAEDIVQTATLRRLFPVLEQTGFLDQYKAVVETGRPFTGEQEYPGPNGHFWYQTTVKKHEDGIIVNFVDVTSQVQTRQQLIHQQAQLEQNELRLQQQTDLLQSVLNATLTAVSTYEPVRNEAGHIVDFRFLLSNQAALTMLSAEELTGKTLCEMNPPLRNSDALAQYVTVAQTGQPVTMERQARGRWFLISVVRFGEDGLLTSSIDITDLKLAQLQIEQLNTQLQRSNQSLDQFAFVASHDLQEPLRKIRTFGDLLLDQYTDTLPADARDLLRRMQSASERMSVLIRDLLTYSRLSKGRQTARQSLDLNGLVNEVLEDLELAIQDKNALIDVGSLPTLIGDPLQLRQVFQNLLSNALKFTKPGHQPQIQVTCRLIPAYEVLMNLPKPKAPSGQYYLVTVADNGIGFAEQYGEKIFGAFERLHSKNSLYGGTGIGLAIVRQVMENHQGAVTAQGREDEGATFTLYFPAVG